MSPVRTKAYLYLLAATVLWGAAAPVVKFTLREIDPMPFLVYRFFLATLVAIPYLSIAKPKFSKKNSFDGLMIIYGFLATTLALTLLFKGLDQSYVLDLSLIGAAAPLVASIGGAYFFHDRITKQEKLGITITLSGVGLTVFAPIIFGMSTLAFSGNILLLLFLFTDQGALLLSKKIMKKLKNPFVLSNIAFIVGFVTLLPFVLLTEDPNAVLNQITSLSLAGHLGVAYMAFFSGLAAYALFARGTKSIEVSEASLFYYLQPIISTPLAVLWLGEQITFAFIVGAIIITSGVSIAEYKKRR